MRESIKVSVIVPVYNVEAYLEKCLISLVEQTLQEIEIIVVNDGSKDQSGAIIARYAGMYPQIRAYEKENGGLSDARNYGLHYATGEYVGFIDSDDYVDLTMYETMYEKAIAEHADIVECNLHHTYENYEDTEIGAIITDRHELIMDGRSVVWNKLYRKEWLQSTGILFSRGIIYEDVDFYVRLIPYVKKYIYVEHAFVHYVQRESSINNMYSAKTRDIFKVLTNILEFYHKNQLYEEYRQALEYLFIRILLCSSFARMCKIYSKMDRQAALRDNYKMLIDYFPEWHNNPYLAKNNSIRGIYMKTINHVTYAVYCKVAPIIMKLQLKRKVS